jgi:hypothetical protein
MEPALPKARQIPARSIESPRPLADTGPAQAARATPEADMANEQVNAPVTRILADWISATDDAAISANAREWARHVLLDWIAGLPMEEIERRNSPSGRFGQIGRGDVERFADATRFHLRAAAEIARVMLMHTAPTEEQSDALLRRLEFGGPSEVLGLLALRANWARGELLALHAIGVTTADALWARSEADLRPILGDARVEALVRLRPAEVSPTA